MSNITHVGGISLPVGANAETYLDQDGNPVPVNNDAPLPVLPSSLRIPQHDACSVTLDGSGSVPVLLVFYKNENQVASLSISWGGNTGKIFTGYSLTVS